jgi:subtilase family protein
MKGFTLRLSLVASLLVMFSLVGALPGQSDNSKHQFNPQSQDRARKGPARPGVRQLSYRSPGANHKLMVPADDTDIEQRLMASRSARKAKKYGAYSLVEVTEAELSSMDASTLDRASVRDDLNLMMLKPGQIDTTGPEPVIDNDLRLRETSSRALHLVQLFGPPTQQTVAALKATGAKIVGYVPNNAYLMWTTRAQRRQLSALRQSADGSSLVQWDGPYHPAYKVDPHIKLDSVEQMSLSIQILDTPEADNTVSLVKSVANKVLMPEFRAAGAVRIKVVAEAYKLKELAQAADVLAIERWSPMKLMDERADQIAAGALSFNTVNNIQVSQPTGPGYLAFLNSVGFNADFDFAVDVGDTGLDTGSPDSDKVHPDFLNAAGASRVAYLHDFTQDFHATDPTILPNHDELGHGTINASIIGGFSNKTGTANVDAQGFQYGLGTAPFARIGASKLFPDSRSSSTFSYLEFISQAYNAGARLSNNSWGGCEFDFCNYYNDDTQVFDFLVRDADLSAPGNQSMTILFASGNDADVLNTPSVAIPGTAKNVITVGLSENVRGAQTDGCGVRAQDADNAQDVVFFSGYGPVQDGRAKPDLVAPGSHMQGAASQDRRYTGNGVCDKYFPTGQTLYTWSSGTSHSTPVVTGGAALAFQWLKMNLGAEPSPALVKAFILNSTSYLNGGFGNDNLPGARQGWGLLNIGRMFENTSRIIYDESPARTFFESGGAPFEATGVIADSTKEFRVMLVWSDPPGSAVTNAPFVNQLNLEVVVGGVVYSGNHFSGQYTTVGGQKDFSNNVQGVRLPAGTTGPIVVRVRPTIIAGDGIPGDFSPLDQDFALVVTNAIESAIPVLTVESAGDVSAGVSVQHTDGKVDSSLLSGESAKVTVTVRNKSLTTEATIQGAALTLGGAPSAGSYNAIAPGQTGTNATPFTIQVPAGLRCGSVATLQLQVDSNAGRFILPVRVQIGRFSKTGGPEEKLLFDDVDNFTVKWKRKAGFDSVQGPAKSGTMSYHVQDPGKEQNDTLHAQLFMKKVVVIPDNAGQVRLSFFHIFNFEPGFDGGILELSTDEGTTWQDVGPFIQVGGYDGTLTATSNNPLGTRAAWTARGRPGVFSQVVADLSSFAGKRVKLRFRAGFDEAAGILNGYTGWYIDDIQVTAVLYSCGQSQAASVEVTSTENSRTARPPRRGLQRIE